jgi:hypothetical protein
VHEDRVCGGESSTSWVFAFMVCHLSAGVGCPPPPALLYQYQNKGLANWAVRKCMKTKNRWLVVSDPSEGLGASEWGESEGTGRRDEQQRREGPGGDDEKPAA